MAAADVLSAAPSREPARHSMTTRIIIYGLLIVFAIIFLLPLVVMVLTSLKPLDEVTGGGPGRATELPATFMYSYTFTRNEMGVGAASAVIMLMTIAAIMVPYLYAELKEPK